MGKGLTSCGPTVLQRASRKRTKHPTESAPRRPSAHVLAVPASVVTEGRQAGVGRDAADEPADRWVQLWGRP